MKMAAYRDVSASHALNVVSFPPSSATMDPSKDPRRLTLTMPYRQARSPSSPPPPPPNRSDFRLNDQKHVKAALQRQGTTPKEVVDNNNTPSNKGVWIAVGSVAVILMALAVALSVVFVVRSGPTTIGRPLRALPPLKRARLESWGLNASLIANEKDCGVGTRFNAASATCEPDYALLLDVASLEARRRGSCSAPVSLSRWVCGDYELDRRNTAKSLIDSYLRTRVDQWISYVFSNIGPSKAAFLDRMAQACLSEIESKRTGHHLEKLRREALAANDWTALSRVLGTATAYGIEALLCLGNSGERLFVFCNLTTEITRRLNSGNDTDSFDRTSFAHGFSDALTRLDIESPVSVADLVASIDPYTPRSLDAWKNYLVSRIVDNNTQKSTLRAAVVPFFEAYILRELTARDGPLDPDGASMRYLRRVFEQIRDAYADAVRESAFLTAPTKDRMLSELARTQLYTPPFEALSSLVLAVDAASSKVGERSCSDTLLVLRAARVARLVSRAFTPAQLYIADLDLLTYNSALRYYGPPLNGMVVVPLALLLLYSPPPFGDPFGMVDTYSSKFGYFMAREFSYALLGSSSPDAERLALCTTYRVLCKHATSQCTSIASDDLDWIRRFFWDAAATNCGDTRRGNALDSAANNYSLYRIAASCNGLYLYSNSSSEALDCFKRAK
jgi:hypothetical protein